MCVCFYIHLCGAILFLCYLLSKFDISPPLRAASNTHVQCQYEDTVSTVCIVQFFHLVIRNNCMYAGTAQVASRCFPATLVLITPGAYGTPQKHIRAIRSLAAGMKSIPVVFPSLLYFFNAHFERVGCDFFSAFFHTVSEPKGQLTTIMWSHAIPVRMYLELRKACTVFLSALHVLSVCNSLQWRLPYRHNLIYSWTLFSSTSRYK